MKKPVVVAMMLAAFSLSSQAYGQRTNNNAVKQADDAFGRSVGDEQIGIYNANLVRGFSPVAAGNLRIEGLYFDQQASPTQRLIGGTSIHVGLSAQGYDFPAPTGIADYELRRPGAKPLTSFSLSSGPWGGLAADADTQIPLDGERLGLALGAGFYKDVQPHHGSAKLATYGVVARFKPSDDLEILPFWSLVRDRDQESQSLIFTTGDFLPPKMPRDRFLGQKWSDFDGDLGNYGLIVKGRAVGLDFGLGVFRSYLNVKQDHIDLLFGTDETGRVANRVVIVDGGNRYASTSGELRVSKSIIEGQRMHSIILSLRGRDQNRLYGGAASASLGQSQLGSEDFRPEQTPEIGDKFRDYVRQKTIGIGYQGRWAHVGEISMGVQKTDYQKDVINPDPAIFMPSTIAKPWLLNANMALYLSDRLAAYAGYTRGLEESPVAPSEASNRNEAPPAIRTSQKEAGLRWKIGGASAVLGWFDISKPYFNLDDSLRFRQLGQVRNQGLELSIAGPIAKGLYVVAGNVWLDATVSGELVDAGTIARRPIGTFRRHTIASADYQVPGVTGLSVNAAYEGTSDRTANAKDSLRIPARGVLHLGARYRFKLEDRAVLVRANVQNIFNTFGWAVGGTGFFIPNGSRRYVLSLAADV